MRTRDKLWYLIVGAIFGAAAAEALTIWMLVNQPPFPFELLGQLVA
jgi:hypothetical protein